ncbi:MAG: 5'/3'-nucleotidase SurE [Candidatus Azobacteroides sp.]|nr:5'/3'-nucleotidase SurE [Candidatus Azobacteroides sp.]
MTLNTRPLILISNDDGVDAKGINSLIESLRLLGDLFIVAPDGGRSGLSCAVTSKIPIRAMLIKEEKGLTIYSCSGTPVDCVKLALGNLLPRKPDLIVSGINHGNNASVNIHYSGTMGIAIEGALNNIPSIGFSLCTHKPDADFSQAVSYSALITKHILEKGLPKGICLNVNIPYGTEVKGIKVCRQAAGNWSEEFEERTDPHNGRYYWLTGVMMNMEPDCTETDEYAIGEGYVSVVPSKIDLTAYEYMEDLKYLEI